MSRKFTEEEVNAALQIAHSEYFLQVVALLSHLDRDDLVYCKVPMTTPEGGNYLVSILHIDGPTIDLKRLAKASEDFTESNKKGPE